MLFLLQNTLGQSCTPDEELCLTPSQNGDRTTIDITFTEFKGWLGFGYGGNGMNDQNMVIISQNENGYIAESYYSEIEINLEKADDIWTVSSFEDGKLTICGSDSKFAAGTFIYASGGFAGEENEDQEALFEEFEVEMDSVLKR